MVDPLGAGIDNATAYLHILHTRGLAYTLGYATETLLATAAITGLTAGTGTAETTTGETLITETETAAKTAGQADHLIPIGPGGQKAWSVLERVTEKGATFNGYKGGKVFDNVGEGMRLPESGPAGRITYREWDVNPNVKGVNRGQERLVTGSDGSAYETTDHYMTFVRLR